MISNVSLDDKQYILVMVKLKHQTLRMNICESEIELAVTKRPYHSNAQL